MARELDEVRAHRFMASVRVGVVDWGIPHGEVRRRLWQLAGNRATAADWGCGGAWEGSPGQGAPVGVLGRVWNGRRRRVRCE